MLPAPLRVPREALGDGAQIVVKGVFDTYMEGENMYCTLVDGTLIE